MVRFLVMEEIFFLVCSSIAVVLLFHHFRSAAKNKKEHKELNLPPGRNGWPFIGETLAYLKPHPATSMGEYMKDHIARYGKIFRSHLFGAKTIVSADVGLNRFILQNEGKLFQSNYPRTMSDIVGKTSVIELVGEEHKFMKGVILNFFNGVRLRNHLLYDVERHALLVVKSLPVGRSFSAQEEARRFTFNVMASQIMSMEPDEPENSWLKGEYDVFIKGVSSAAPIDLPGTAFREAKKHRTTILKFLSEKMEERLKKMDVNDVEAKVEDDLLDMALKNPDLNTEQILDLVLSIIFAGHETTTTAIALAIFFLGDCPKAVERMRKEHLEIARKKKERGDCILSWEDFKEMEFTHCVINETLRLGNVARFVHRKALKDIKYKDFDIPCGWNVFPVFAAVHLDPSVYKDPQTFNPWRWENDYPGGPASTSSFMAFCGGSRLCPGIDLAKAELAFFFHHLLLNYRWELAEPDCAMVYPFIDFPKGLPIVAYRLPGEEN